MEEKKIPRAPSKKEHKEKLLFLLDKWQKDGLTAEQAIEKLTPKQYDFLIDCGIDFDNELLTAEQRAAIKEIIRAPRPLFPNGYKKNNYPAERQELFNSLVKLLLEKKAKIQPKEKENFRDLDFEIDGKKYRIVLSMPTKNNNKGEKENG